MSGDVEAELASLGVGVGVDGVGGAAGNDVRTIVTVNVGAAVALDAAFDRCDFRDEMMITTAAIAIATSPTAA